MPCSDETGSDREPKGELWVDRWILPAVRESTLFPLLLVVIGHVAAFVAPALLFAVRDRQLGAQVGVLALIVLTSGCVRFEIRRHRRPDLLSLILLATWLLSGAAAWACDRYGLF
jgi:hypothetical protein